MFVGQVKKAPSDSHRQSLFCVQRAEPDARQTGAIVDARAEVHLQKVRKTRHGGQKRGSEVLHEKRDDTQVGFARERIYDQSFRQRPLKLGNGILPGQEEQLAPLL